MKSKAYIILTALFLMSIPVIAQSPPPPNGNGSNPNGSNTPVGGDAPIGSGLFVLLAMGAAYGGKKLCWLNINQQQG